MLELGQWVQIVKSPTYGADYFDNDYINTQDWIVSIYMKDGHYVYELFSQDEDCLWMANELTGTDTFEDINKPLLDIGDEVYKDGDTQDIHTITAISVDGDDFICDISQGLWYGDWELTLCRKKDGAHPEYTLF